MYTTGLSDLATDKMPQVLCRPYGLQITDAQAHPEFYTNRTRTQSAPPRPRNPPCASTWLFALWVKYNIYGQKLLNGRQVAGVFPPPLGRGNVFVGFGG